MGDGLKRARAAALATRTNKPAASAKTPTAKRAGEKVKPVKAWAWYRPYGPPVIHAVTTGKKPPGCLKPFRVTILVPERYLVTPAPVKKARRSKCGR